jgi:hypothetical protein
MAGNMTGAEKDTGRYCIIHGHFYQPPRENPWLGIIETQPSAAPAHDWNERVYNDCYRPNAYSRILDSHGAICGIYNNYQNLSFNFGPTLFSWLEETHPDVAERIIDADRESCERLNGHGNALAQVFNHIILPLASRRDTLTQIRWAKEFFFSRFKRLPEGMWLSETAINNMTAECLVEEGIRFVILAPSQAESITPLGQGRAEKKGHSEQVDTRKPYRVFTKAGDGRGSHGFLDVFFFNDKLSREASFGGLCNNAGSFAEVLSLCIDQASGVPQVVVLATDGETFGHHKPFADMCLSYFFTNTAQQHNLTPVNFAWFLDRYPPQFEAKLKNGDTEGTAWSCAHGTGRWCRDCGCSTGGRDGWNQKWRGPLRNAFDALQKKVDAEYEGFLSGIINDPWALRDRLVSIMQQKDISYLKTEMVMLGAKDEITSEKLHRTCELLDAQKFMLFSYTSCGWFFADVAGIEAVQNMKFACRALQLALSGREYDKALEEILAILETAAGNEGGVTGKDLFLEHAVPFTKYREIIAYAMAIESAVSGGRDFTANRFGHSIKVLGISRRSRNDTDVFIVHMSEVCRKRNSVYSVCVTGGYGAETSGKVLPFDVRKQDGFDIECEAHWSNHAHCVSLRPGELFTEARAGITALFVKQLDAGTTARYLAWMIESEKVLGAIAVINGQLPPFLKEPVAYLITSQWNSAAQMLCDAGREQEALSHFIEIKRKAGLYGIAIDFSNSEILLGRLLSEQVEMLSSSLTIDSCDRMRYLLNMVDRFSLKVFKHNLEDRFYPVLYGPVRELYDEVTSGNNVCAEKKAFLAGLLSFARRMNFSIEKFPL